MNSNSYIQLPSSGIQIGDVVRIAPGCKSDVSTSFLISTSHQQSNMLYEAATRDGKINSDMEAWGVRMNQAYKVEEIFICPYELQPGTPVYESTEPYFVVVYPASLAPDKTNLPRYIIPYWALLKIDNPQV